jgi:hypothetical protein
MTDETIRQVRRNKTTGQLSVTLPKNSIFEKEDFVKITKLKFEEVKTED